ncbi:hypothetical protein FBU59_002942 [Linderina macrospora]|uniref:Uncharacterized protein n=1 Tax=Linderina macrospora TaxID=4868 RepID=A0ACC1J9Q2_9FUNG|nr:hypothetical protein FBU59_002942 [Linderina macrospora]
MVLLGHILGANEGLLSNVIRDNGIGYSPKLLYDGRMQTCTLACDKTFDVNEAFDALQTALLDISSNWTKRVDKFQLEVARSVTLFRQIKSASSPSKLLVGTAEACLEGFADLAAKHRWANEHLHAVTLDDLRHVFDTFVMQLAGTSHQSPAIAVAVTSSGDTCRVGKQELETKQLEDLFH